MPSLRPNTEEFVSRTGENNDPRSRFAANVIDAIAHLVTGAFGEHVPVFGTIDGNGPDRAIFFVENGFVGHVPLTCLISFEVDLKVCHTHVEV